MTDTASGKKPVVLRLYKGEQLLGVKQFPHDAQIVIGKPGDVQVALDGDRVSLIHAAIEERATGYFISDLGSEAGTFKNGVKVLDEQIESGDIIQIGEFRVEFNIGVPRPKPVGFTGTLYPPTQETTSAPTPPSVAPPVTAASPVAPPPPATAAPPPMRVVPSVVTTVAPTVAPPPVQQTPPPVEKPAPSFAFSNQVTGSGIALAGPETKSPSRPTARQTAAPRGSGHGAGHGSGHGGRSKLHSGQKTFAPPSRHGNVTDYVKPSKGTVVEVLVAWRERVISTSHFTKQQTVTIGSHPDCDIVLPVFSSRSRKVPIVRIDARATALVTPEMTGELIRGQSSSSFVELLRQSRMNKEGAAYALPLEQGEMVRVDLNDQISIIIRYVSDSPKPLVAPILDFTTSEATGVVLAFAVVALLWLYTFLYTPVKPLDDSAQQEPMRTALIIMPPTPVPVPPPQPPQPPATPVPTPPSPVVRATPSPVKAPVPVAASKSKKETPVTNLTTKNDPGKSANAAPNKNKTGPRTLTSPKQGGSVKTAAKEGSQMQSKPRDVSKMAMFSVFGGKGANSELAQATTGAGELAGTANQATGRAGYAENRAGVGLGSDVKDTGQGGTGKSLVGIAGGVGTNGRGSGNSGYGTGGLGTHSGTKIVPGGEGESISGTIDREAIRRVILANLKVIRTCYERQLDHNHDLMGKVILSWDIGEGGQVTATRVRSSELTGAGAADVAKCVMDHLKTWKFPDPPANQVVEVEAYPFYFSN